MKSLVIGGNSGLGKVIRDHLSAVALNKLDFDITTSEGISAIKNMINLINPDLIVVNSFSLEKMSAQQEIVEKIWEKIKDTNKTLVVLSSIARMTHLNLASLEYSNIKKNLSNKCAYLSMSGTAKMIVLEPSFIENKVRRDLEAGNISNLYLTYEEFLNTLDASIAMSRYSKLVVLAQSGIHPIQNFLN